MTDRNEVSIKKEQLGGSKRSLKEVYKIAGTIYKDVAQGQEVMVLN